MIFKRDVSHILLKVCLNKVDDVFELTSTAAEMLRFGATSVAVAAQGAGFPSFDSMMIATVRPTARSTTTNS